MSAHPEYQLRGEPRVKQRRAHHIKLKLVSLATLVVATALRRAADSLPVGATAFGDRDQFQTTGWED